jgi:hypothetical protein
MGGLERPPKPPARSARPGGPGARLGLALAREGYLSVLHRPRIALGNAVRRGLLDLAPRDGQRLLYLRVERALDLA